MREINVSIIREAVQKMCVDMNYYIGADIKKSFEDNYKTEASPIGKAIILDLIENSKIASDKQVPICQDTGMIIAFVEVGQEVVLVGGDISEAINEGIRRGYGEGYLRKSVVSDPLIRQNSKDNTPGVIYYDIVAGDQVKIKLAAKGFGSENMSRSKMLKPSDGIKGVESFVVETVSLAGPNPCPPIVVGVGIGGTIDKAAQIAKKALMRDLESASEHEHIKALEERLLEQINDLGIGPQGLGGTTTALGVNVEIYPTHIAGLPVVVNINCHASRHLETVI
ncbi:fumarate hydratase [Fusibacter ferrireducens]|uniref:Fumarate hydratase n=1 Tax=Fusibacter ferrireducens TaxID=2785058 RepID=A0ABS0A058_9FIRM|nr:fumarate hydratase [Fusibacter ferrireducens]MBF4695611.1 fumarate hydratase [Fusibacter ferrireducens]